MKISQMDYESDINPIRIKANQKFKGVEIEDKNKEFSSINIYNF